MSAALRIGGPTPQQAFTEFLDHYERWRIVVDGSGEVIAAVARDPDSHVWFAWDRGGRIGPFTYLDNALSSIKSLHPYVIRYGMPNKFGRTTGGN